MIDAALYTRVKYLDDGRELVTPTEFVSLHFTLTFMSGWMSYQLAIQFLILLTKMCSNQESTFLEEFQDQVCVSDRNTTLDLGTIAVFSMLGVELSIYLANYKDICYGLVMLLYLGPVYSRQK